MPNKQITFGDMVVVEKTLIGVVVKLWNGTKGANFDVYVREFNGIRNYNENDIDRYLVRHKYLEGDDIEYQFNGVNNL